jgi:predicted transcriptional regulator
MSLIGGLNQIRELRRKIVELEYRTSALESLHENDARADEERIIELLVNPATVPKLSETIDKHSVWVSLILNRLRKNGMVKDVDKIK